MLIRDGKEYRNLQQQVAENTDDIAELKQGGVGFEVYSKTEADAKFQTIAGMTNYATQTDLADKQDKLTAGTNITIDENNVISATGSSYTAGAGIDITGSTISVDATTVPFKTDLSTVATSGSYTDLSNKPDLSIYETKAEAFSGSYTDLSNKPDLSVYETKAEAFSGNYNDLTNKPTIPHTVAAGTGLSLTTGTSTDIISVDSTYVPAQIENQLTLSSNDKVTGICGYNIASSGVCIHYLTLTQTGFTVYCNLITDSGTQFNTSTLIDYLYTNSLTVPATGIGEIGSNKLHVANITATAGLTPTAVIAVGLIDSNGITSLTPVTTFTVTDTVIAI